MVNAQKELLDHVKDREVELVKIVYREYYSRSNPLRIEGALAEVLPMLNFEYDSGYGGQELFGYIWYTDGTWSERDEYDGSEWWNHQVMPDKDKTIDSSSLC